MIFTKFLTILSECRARLREPGTGTGSSTITHLRAGGETREWNTRAHKLHPVSKLSRECRAGTLGMLHGFDARELHGRTILQLVVLFKESVMLPYELCLSAAGLLPRRLWRGGPANLETCIVGLEQYHQRMLGGVHCVASIAALRIVGSFLVMKARAISLSFSLCGELSLPQEARTEFPLSSLAVMNQAGLGGSSKGRISTKSSQLTQAIPSPGLVANPSSFSQISVSSSRMIMDPLLSTRRYLSAWAGASYRTTVSSARSPWRKTRRGRPQHWSSSARTKITASGVSLKSMRPR